ncbi:MAG: hypothetical protein JXR67_04480 [Bacteroidales bacterium]|nr:hypothetical protein [Bacteroidales bacterium]
MSGKKHAPGHEPSGHVTIVQIPAAEGPFVLVLLIPTAGAGCDPEAEAALLTIMAGYDPEVELRKTKIGEL